MNPLYLFITIFLFLIILGVLLVLLLKFRSSQSESKDKIFELMNELIKETSRKIDDVRKEMHETLSKNTYNIFSQIQSSNKAVNERLDNAAKVIGEFTKELGRMREIGKSMQEIQEFLLSPKLRGNIGEEVLRDLLEQYFPKEHFKVQYKFRAGHIVDAVLKTDKGLIPIDSKFPMENFRKLIKAQNEEEKQGFQKLFIRDVKKHIDAISNKYILPQEGTVDFAVMYIPSETVYYEVIKLEIDLIDYARRKKVLVVSPNVFYYFLKIIMMGIEERRIEQASKEILKMLSALKTDTERFSKELRVLTTHVTNAKVSVDRVNNEFLRLSGKIDQIDRIKSLKESEKMIEERML